MTYALLADVHLNRWSAFATEENGQNSRLMGLLREIERAAQVVLDKGGHTLVIAGDLFHVRGSISPSVMTPTLDTFQRIKSMGVTVIIVPGNHDLEGKNSDRAGNACVALESAGLARIAHKVTFADGMCLVPWHDSVRELKKTLTELKPKLKGIDLIIHAPVNGVIMGLPDHGLDPAFLKSLGANRVFAGHYHNHKAFDGDIYSIGALAHHTWNDVGSTAGFLMVYDGKLIAQYPSCLPKFVDVHGDDDPKQVEKLVPGNYVRVRTESMKQGDHAALRKFLVDQMGALDVIILATKKPTQQRAGAVSSSIQAGASTEQSIGEFVTATCDAAIANEVAINSLRVLSLVDHTS